LLFCSRRYHDVTVFLPHRGPDGSFAQLRNRIDEPALGDRVVRGVARVSVPNRGELTFSIMLANIMQRLDTAIANVALPHIRGSLSASLDRISWVLTSYIVAAPIMMPLTGWLAAPSQSAFNLFITQ
jgi:hypothetical protein